MNNIFRVGEKVEWIGSNGSRSVGTIIEYSHNEKANRVEYLVKKEEGKYVVVWEQDLRRIGDGK